jgi:hypothetical protein
MRKIHLLLYSLIISFTSLLADLPPAPAEFPYSVWTWSNADYKSNIICNVNTFQPYYISMDSSGYRIRVCKVATSDYRERTQLFGIDNNNGGHTCPSGTNQINTYPFCENPNCEDGSVISGDETGSCSEDTNGDGWSDTLVAPPPLPVGADEDFDGDGIPNKDDRDFAISHPDEFGEFDTDNDGILNKNESDEVFEGVNNNCNISTYPLQPNQKIYQGVTPQAVGTKEPTAWGYVSVDFYDSSCNYTLYTVFECPYDNIYNIQTEQCDTSPKDFAPDVECEAGYGKRNFYDFNGVGYISQDLQDKGATHGHCYQQYSCKSDYTVYKLQEVSCSDTKVHHEMVISPDSNDSWSVKFAPYGEGSGTGSSGSGTSTSALGSDYNFSSKSDFDIVNNYNSSSSLDSIDKSLKGQDENGSSDGSIGGDFGDGIDFINGVKDGASALVNDIGSIQNKLSTGFVASNVNVGSAPIFKGTVFGKETTISMCSSLSYFADVFYYVFSLIFMWYGIVLYYLGFKERG